MNVLLIYFLVVFNLLIVFKSAISCHGNLLASGIKEDEKTIILREHNRLRQIVATGQYPGQPAAENMREIIWDNELAALAQKWADNCQFRHDPHRTINRFTMGQNLAIIWSTIPLDESDGDFTSRIQSWFNEVQKYTFGAGWSPKTGHYTQMVWGETNLVGCGFSEYKDATKYNKLYVCNYGPGGNVVGFKPYDVGKPSCSRHGLKPSSHYHGLCDVPHLDSNNNNINTIETYEYMNNNDFSNNQSPFSTQTLQIQYSPLHIKQAYSFTQTLSESTGSKAPTSSSSQTGIILQKYKSKVEAYKTTVPKFDRKIHKQTSRPYLINENKQRQKKDPEQQSQQKLHFILSSTPKPIKRGWSLLTWRG